MPVQVYRRLRLSGAQPLLGIVEGAGRRAVECQMRESMIDCVVVLDCFLSFTFTHIVLLVEWSVLLRSCEKKGCSVV
jgi:hypothetical protein